MKKNDDSIQKLFDDYAEGLQERGDLSSRARQALAEQNAKRAKQRKLKFWNWLAPVFAVLIVVVSISIWSPIFGGQVGTVPNPPDGSGDGSTQNAQITYYSLSDVKGRTVSASQIAATLDVSPIESDDEFVIVAARYYAFYFENGELAYVKAILRVRSEEGLCEITIIAEVDGLVRKDLRDYYDNYIRGNDYPTMNTQLGEKGEYVTNACFNSANAHYYVVAMTGANGQLAEKIISKIC